MTVGGWDDLGSYVSYMDEENWMPEDIRGLESNIKELQKSIQVLKQWEVDKLITEGY